MPESSRAAIHVPAARLWVGVLVGMSWKEML
jgi:hypothetical protein